MRMGHTKGPWKVYHKVFRPQLSSRKVLEVQDSNGNSVVPWTGFDSANQSTKEKIANARLIAAAPELLEALKDAIQTAGLEKHPFRPWHLTAREVIKKAEGK